MHQKPVARRLQRAFHRIERVPLARQDGVFEQGVEFLRQHAHLRAQINRPALHSEPF